MLGIWTSLLLLPAGCSSDHAAQLRNAHAAVEAKAATVDQHLLAELRSKHAELEIVTSPDSKPSARVDLSSVEDIDGALQLVLKLPRVERLVLDGLRLKSQHWKRIRQLVFLRWLDISRTPVKNDELACVDAMPNLEFLILWGTSVGDEGLPQLLPLKHLKKLDLSGTQISDQGIMQLAEIPSLEEVHIESPRITASAAKALQAKLPHALVVY